MQPLTEAGMVRGAAWHRWFAGLLAALVGCGGDPAGPASLRTLSSGTTAIEVQADSAVDTATGSGMADAAAGAGRSAPGAGKTTYRLVRLGGPQPQTFDLNERSQVAFSEIVSPGRAEGRFYDGRSVIPLATLGGLSSFTTGVNEHGQVVGFSNFGPGDFYHAFLWNARGQIVGRYGLGRAFLWTPGVEFIDLGGAGGNAEAINDKETIAGTIAGINRAGVWTRDTGFVDIGAPGSATSSAFDVNNRGQVAGFSQVAGGFDQRAFLWTRDDGMIDLNTRLGNAPPGLLLAVAQRINDKGAILAHDTAGALYLLVPGAGAHEAPAIAPVKIGGAARVGGALSFSAAFTDVDVRDTQRRSGPGATAGRTPDASAASPVPRPSAAGTPTAAPAFTPSC